MILSSRLNTNGQALVLKGNSGVKQFSPEIKATGTIFKVPDRNLTVGSVLKQAGTTGLSKAGDIVEIAKKSQYTWDYNQTVSQNEGDSFYFHNLHKTLNQELVRIRWRAMLEGVYMNASFKHQSGVNRTGSQLRPGQVVLFSKSIKQQVKEPDRVIENSEGLKLVSKPDQDLALSWNVITAKDDKVRSQSMYRWNLSKSIMHNVSASLTYDYKGVFDIRLEAYRFETFSKIYYDENGVSKPKNPAISVVSAISEKQKENVKAVTEPALSPLEKKVGRYSLDLENNAVPSRNVGIMDKGNGVELNQAGNKVLITYNEFKALIINGVVNLSRLQSLIIKKTPKGMGDFLDSSGKKIVVVPKPVQLEAANIVKKIEAAEQNKVPIKEAVIIEEVKKVVKDDVIDKGVSTQLADSLVSKITDVDTAKKMAVNTAGSAIDLVGDLPKLELKSMLNYLLFGLGVYGLLKFLR